MKIEVVYEKADLLRLVERDLREKGIRLRPGAPMTYRGALSVRVSVDADEEEGGAPPMEIRSPALPGAEEPGLRDDEPIEMTEVLAASRRLEAEATPIFEITKRPPRRLLPGESYEYPKE